MAILTVALGVCICVLTFGIFLPIALRIWLEFLDDVGDE